MHILRLAALPLALGLALSGCLDPDAITSSDPSQSSAQAGGVAFHLSGADSLALVGKADSVRIEASRTGYPTHSVSGSLFGTTRLSDLEPGLWSLRIALYDANLAIRWAGDTTVAITSGTTADAVVRLRPATGSVNVRIVLDSTSPGSAANDTLPVGYAQWTNDAKWGVIKAWRTHDGIYLYAAPPTCAFTPTVRLGSIPWQCDSNKYCTIPYAPIVDSSTLVLGGSSDPLIDCYNNPVALPPVTHFVRWTRRGAVTLHTSTGDVVLPDPAFPGTGTDSSFASYAFSISGFMSSSYVYTLDATGQATLRIECGRGICVDTLIETHRATLPPDSLAVALSILQSSIVRHPATLDIDASITDSNAVASSCPTDAPYYSRKISYANGASADLSWSFSNYCGTLPAGYQSLRRVDAMLQAVFSQPQVLLPAKPWLDTSKVRIFVD